MILNKYVLGLLLIVNQTFAVKIAFGSCFKFYRSHKSDVFARIGQHQPDLFVWLGTMGDAAYLDIMVRLGTFIHDDEPKSIEAKFNITNKDYRSFSARHKVLGVYDDHDYGLNNGDHSNPIKAQIQQQYLDFLDYDQHHPLRSQEGLYQSYSLTENIEVLLIDNRYHYNKESGDLLGESQWRWLEERLSNQSIHLFIIGSGIQIIPDDRMIPESWPAASKERLYALITQHQARVIFISGDVHQTEVLENPCGQSQFGRRIVEFTSSGINFANADQYLFYDFVSNFVFPNTYNSRSDRFYNQNFGILDITLSESSVPTQVTFTAYHSLNSNPVLKRVVNVTDLETSEITNQTNEACAYLGRTNPKERFWANVELAAHDNMVTLFQLALGLLMWIIISTTFCVWWVKKTWTIYKHPELL